jgi:hypothetical protein
MVFKGFKHSDKTKKFLSKIQKGNRNSPKTEFKKGQIPWNKGKKLNKDHIKKLSDSHKGKKLPKEQKDKISKVLIGNKNPFYGRKHSKKTKLLIGEKSKGRIIWNKGKEFLQIRGEKHHNWKGGITSINNKIRQSLEYKLWRTAVFERDRYTCIWC